MKPKPIPTGSKHLTVEVFSNFDKQVNPGVVAQLARGGCIASHVAQNFYGLVWCEDGRWFEAIKKHRAHVATLEASSPESLIAQANERFESA